MKLLLKLILAVLVIGVLLPFTVLKDDNGQPMMKFSDFGLPDIPFNIPGFSLPDTTTLKPSGKSNLQTADELRAADDNLAGKVVFYQWRDSAGNIQFTGEPPPEGIEYTIKGYDPDANVIPSVKIPTKDKEADDDRSAAEKLKDGESINPYGEDTIKKLFEDAKKIEKMLNQRYQEQTESVNQ